MEDFKSPLPPRQLTNLDPEEDEAKVLPNTEQVNSEPLPETPPAPMPQVETKKPFDVKKLLVWGGIVGLVIAIFFLVTKVVIPAMKGGGSSEITLNYWGLWEDSSIIDGLIADFEAKNPGIKINYIRNQKDDYRSRLQGRLAKDATTEEVPDLFRLHASWLPAFSNNLAVVPTATATALDLDKDFYSTYQEDLKVSGKYMAVPLMYDGLQLFYNKDLIESAQINLPKTWWGLENAATKLTVKDATGKIKIAGVAMGLTENVDHWSDIVGLMLKQNGVDLTKNDDNNNKKLQDVITYYTIFSTKDQVWEKGLAASTQAFADGKVAFYFAPSWRVFNLEDMQTKVRYGITKVPQLPTLASAQLDQIESGQIEGDLTNINWATYWVEGVNSKSKHQKEAWKFLEYLASKEGLEKLYTAASQTRSFGEIYPRKSMATMLSGDSKIKPFLDSADSASSGYLSSRTFDAGLNDEMSKYFEDAINGILYQNQQPADVMPALKSGINQIVQKYQLTK